jgi:hypothetical protein
MQSSEPLLTVWFSLSNLIIHTNHPDKEEETKEKERTTKEEEP